MFIKEYFILIYEMVDLRDFSIKQLADFGMSVAIHSAMNGGKTETLTREMRRAFFFGFNSMAYNSILNAREQNAIVVNGEDPHPALTVGPIADIKKDFIDRRKQLAYFLDKPTTWGEEIVIRDVPHIKGYPLRVLGVDEVNFFMRNDQEAEEMLELVDWCSDERVASYFAGLSHDFRHMPFGLVERLFKYADIDGQKKPACMGIPEGKIKCAKTATHTQRIWTREYAKTQGLEDLPDFNYVDKDHRRIIGVYVPAPFFDLTVASEEAEKKRKSDMDYLPVCKRCSNHPYKNETKRVLDFIRKGENPFSAIESELLTWKILEFLTNPVEGYARKTEGGIYMPLHKHNPFS
jgi:thymidine kinase